MRSAGSRTRTGILLVCLLALAVLIEVIGSGLNSSSFQVGVRIHALSTVSVTPNGILLVRTFLRETNGSETPIVGADVTLTDQSRSLLPPLVFKTNGSGDFQVDLSPSQFSVSVSDLLFQASTQVPVYSLHTTEVDAAVSKTSYGVAFAELSDGPSSGYQGPWSPVFMSVSSTGLFKPSSTVFIDANYSLGTLTPVTGLVFLAGDPPTETPATVINSYFGDPGQTGPVWVTLMPRDFLPLANLQSVVLATYAANLRVVVIGP